MLIVMQRDATPDQIEFVLKRVETMGLTPHPLPGPTRTAIGVTGNTGAIDPGGIITLPGVRDVMRVTTPYKLAGREMQSHDTVVALPQANIGDRTFVVMAGPCSVESAEMIDETASFLSGLGVRVMRGGAFKPRTSPYSFQGMEQEGLRILDDARKKYGLSVVSEIVDYQSLSDMEQAVDMLQIGARNMQNFALLKRVAASRTPVLLKRGPSATLDEWLMAAEYLLSGGNKQVAVCERGVRTFATHTRNTLDLSAVPAVKAESHLPIIVDPSHGTGRRDFVPAMARAALAAGADGLMIEVHPRPDQALSDGAQSLDFQQFETMYQGLKELAVAVGRELV